MLLSWRLTIAFAATIASGFVPVLDDSHILTHLFAPLAYQPLAYQPLAYQTLAYHINKILHWPTMGNLFNTKLRICGDAVYSQSFTYEYL